MTSTNSKTLPSVQDDQLIGDLYHAAIDPERWTELLDRMARCMGSKGAAMLSLKGGDDGYRVSRANSLYHNTKQIEIYAQKYSHHEADVFRRVMENPPGTDVRDQRFLNDEIDVKTYPDVRFLLENYGVLERFGVRLNEDEGWFDTIAFQYAADRGNASKAEFARLELLRPHLTQTLIQSRMFNALRSQYKAVLGMLDKVNQAMFLVTPKGHVVLANQTAYALVDQQDVLEIRTNGILRSRNPASSSAILHGINLVSDTVRCGGIVSRNLVQLPRSSGRPSCLAEISPLQDTDGEIDSTFKGAMISIVDPEYRAAIDLEGIDIAYGLSVSEGEVAALLVNGLTNVEIADHRGVAVDTVKSQVRALYAKSGSTNRTEFVRRVLQFNVPLQTPER